MSTTSFAMLSVFLTLSVLTQTLQAATTCPRLNNPEQITQQLNNGELSPDEQPTSSITTCSQGPKSVYHTVQDMYFKPSISKFSCEGLFCEDPPCYARSTELQTKCVHVWKRINNVWVYQGQQVQIYQSHLSCGCKNCTDITSAAECKQTSPCPNPKNQNSFCYWTPQLTTVGPKFEFSTSSPSSQGSLPIQELPTIGLPDPGVCQCCYPYTCPLSKQIFSRERCRCECAVSCLPGQVLNEDTCECGCPNGTKMTLEGECVGNCSLVSWTDCPEVKCAENPHLSCKRVGTQCTCPSCADISINQAQELCTKTKCLEQKSQLYCKIDPCEGNCRCPTCEEQPDRTWCANTYCGPENKSQQCRWDSDLNRCSCPKVIFL